MDKPRLSIIIPTFNSATHLVPLLDSLLESSEKEFEVIINDDSRTQDETSDVIEKFKKRGLDILYLQENESRAQARRLAVQCARGDILLHLDSDMVVSEALIEECCNKVEEGFDALVIPEESFGTTFWAQCKWLEKRCYNEEGNVECLRCVRKDLYDKVDGHNPEMIFAEDMDLHIRVAAQTNKIGRTQQIIFHNEGSLQLLNTLQKKYHYAHTAHLFAKKHPDSFKWQANLFSRYLLFLRKGKYFFSYPLIYTGMIFMKTGEFAAGALGLLLHRKK